MVFSSNLLFLSSYSWVWHDEKKAIISNEGEKEEENNLYTCLVTYYETNWSQKLETYAWIPCKRSIDPRCQIIYEFSVFLLF